jgi:adenylate cyclase
MLERASELAQKAMVLEDSLPAPHVVLSTVYIVQKYYDQAVAEGERAVTLDPNDAASYQLLGATLSVAGRPEEGIDLIKKAMRLNPHYPPLYVTNLCVAYRMTGRYKEALVWGKKLVSLAPNYPPAHFNLAIVYSELGRMEEARAEVEELRRINPTVSLEIFKQFLPYKDPAVVERHLEAMRRAGLK